MASRLDDPPVPLRYQLSAMWVALMLLYAYADILSFYKPGTLAEIGDGMMGPLKATQASLFFAAILMAIPSLMVAATLMLPQTWSRWLNVVLGGLYAIVNISNIAGEIWMYYVVLGVIEIGITVNIIGTAWRWRPTATS